MEREEIELQLKKYLSMKENWDGYGSLPILPEVYTNASNFVTVLNDTLVDRISDVFPSTHSTVFIEWEEKKGKVQLEIGKGNYSYFVEINNEFPKTAQGIDLMKDIVFIEKDLYKFFSLFTKTGIPEPVLVFTREQFNKVIALARDLEDWWNLVYTYTTDEIIEMIKQGK